MNQTVSVLEKKVFLRWFLKRYQMKKNECKWILNYLLSHDEILEKLHFVEEAHYCPSSMVMSVKEAGGVPFRFYKGVDMSSDATKAFHHIRLNPSEEMYIQLNFPGFTGVEHIGVLEENPHMPNGLYRNDKDAELANQLIEHVMNLSKEEAFNRMINEALDTGNKGLFMELTSQLAVTS